MYKPDIFCAGIKEKYVVQKMGIPCKQLHSYDYGGPYAGFQGAINFYREIDRMVNTRIWSFITPPWEKEKRPDARRHVRSQPLKKEADHALTTYHRRSGRTQGADDQSGQDLPADRRHVRGPGHPQLPAAQPRLAGVLLLSPQHPHPALQGAGHGRHQLLHRRLLGVRRPGQPAPGHHEHLRRLQAGRDRRPHDLPLGDHRRRHPADHRQGAGTKARFPRASASSTPTRPATSARTSPASPTW